MDVFAVVMQTIYEISELGKGPTLFIFWTVSFVVPINDVVERVLGGVLSFLFGISFITLAIIGLSAIIW